MAIEYNFKYMPLVGKLSGKSMAEQTETAINEIAKIVNDNTAQAEIINTLAEEANANSVEALEKATEALETSSRVYIKEAGAVDLDSYCESQLIYINNIFSQNLPVESKGFLEVKTNDDKTQATQVFIDDLNEEIYTRSGAITETQVGDVTTYTASYGAWNKSASINYVDNMVLIRQNSTEYTVGDIARSTSLASYMLLECTSAGTTGASEPSFEGADVGDVITDGSVSWTIIKYASTEYVQEEVANYLPLSGGTMTGSVTINKSNSTVGNPAIKLTGAGQNFIISASDTDVTKGTAPSSTHYWGIDFYGNNVDSVNKRIGVFETSLTASNVCSTAITAYNCTTNTSAETCKISVNVDGNGNAYTYAPTPAQTDDSTKIATTAYVKDCVPKSIGSANIPVYIDANGVITSTGKSFANYATLASPTLTGTPKAPTPSVADDSTNIATTAYVKDCVPKSIGGTQRPVYTNSNGVITACTATGSNGGLEGVTTVGGNYIRYTSGVQICWGIVEPFTSAKTLTTTLPAAFVNTTYKVVIGRWWVSSDTEEYYVHDTTTTNFKLTTIGGVGGGSHGYMYIAIGKWK